MRVSVLITVYNEGESVHALMDSLAAQTRAPDEIVIVDGGSTDDTVQRLQGYSTRMPLKLIVQHGANISTGRNRAAAESTGDLFAITDAGVALPPDWLEAISAPFFAPSPPDVVSGFFHAAPQSVFEVALGATTLPALSDIQPEQFLPSSRSVAVRRSAFERVGGYPEWLDYCEDLIFDLNLKEFAAFAFAPRADVAFRPRGSLHSFYTQYYRYARGDGKADLWRKRHAIRYITYLVGLPLIVWLGFGGVGWVGQAASLVMLIAGAIVYTARPYQRLGAVMRAYAPARRVTLAEWAWAVALVPVIRVVGDVAKMIGYPVGVMWRLKQSLQ
ncbi:MAG: glycosyltransferase [Phototrophicaceae bacterium]|jgi:glycosyltransferase involved in cell wall biosynthesis